MLVARRGKVAWVSVQGKRDPAQPDPMKLDSIFRIYSMTKPIVTTTLMQLVEEGRLQISDPVSKYLPEIGNMGVLRFAQEDRESWLCQGRAPLVGTFVRRCV